MEISLCMIVRNEEATLGRCLESVRSCVDEIVIVDTGSTDSSKEQAFAYTDKVYDFPWCDDFSAARNYAFSFATKDLIMWLDADDVLLPVDAEKISDLKQTLADDINIVYMPYEIAFDENGNSTFSYYRERIVRRSADPKWIEPVHEVISIGGKSVYLDAAVKHKKIKTNPSGRNLKIMEKTIAEGKPLSPRLTFYYARELKFNGRTEDAVNVFEHFISSNDGWSENKICACQDLSECYEFLGNDEKAMDAAISSLRFGVPQAKTLCRIGELFFKSGRFHEAIYWYKAALSCPKSFGLGFTETDYYGYVPALQLCVIYDKLNDKNTAEHYNEIAGSFRPDSPAYLYNKNYFEKL